jgi:TRAP transporter 4TM/12TM fusion protein
MHRSLKGAGKEIFYWGTIAFSLFQLYTAGFGFLPDLKQRAVHIIFGLSLLLISYDYKKRAVAESRVSVWDAIFIVIVLLANLNIFFVYEKIYLAPGFSASKDLILGASLSLIVLEATRRSTGWVIPLLTVLAMVYNYAGPYLPGSWSFPSFPTKHLLNSLYYSASGIYGEITSVSATVVAVFIIFGSLLLFTGGGETFIALALRLAGKYRGGPAKVAILASCLFGTISGSAVANVMVTGTYTIPLMKRLGYRPSFAGAVEATASTGGMITPPIMGVGAFIMAELIQIPYLKIIFYAIVPCLLYYGCLFAGVHFEALRFGLSGIPQKEIPSWREVLALKKIVPFFLPILVLLGLLVEGFDITGAGFYSSMAVVVLFFAVDFSPANLKRKMGTLGQALSNGGKALVEIVATLVCVNMLVSLLSATGVALKFSGVIAITGELNPILAFLMAAVIPILLGMGITPAAVYIIAASICASALIRMGPDILQTHMFLFYYSCLAPITPPVCLACYVAANLAEAPWGRVAFTAVRLGAVGFLVPFFFITNPALLLRAPFGDILHACLTAIIGVIFMAAGFFGFFTGPLNSPVRILYIVGGMLLFHPGLLTDSMGITMIGLGFLYPVLSGRIRETTVISRAPKDNGG